MKKNGEIQSTTLESVSGNQNDGVHADAYKTFDIKKAVRQDVGAAVSLLSLILDNPHILDLVTAEIEKIRAKIIEQESLPKKEDFHPEMSMPDHPVMGALKKAGGKIIVP